MRSCKSPNHALARFWRSLILSHQSVCTFSIAVSITLYGQDKNEATETENQLWQKSLIRKNIIADCLEVAYKSCYLPCNCRCRKNESKHLQTRSLRGLTVFWLKCFGIKMLKRILTWFEQRINMFEPLMSAKHLRRRWGFIGIISSLFVIY